MSENQGSETLAEIPITLVKVKCKYCGYEWYTRSYKKYVGCPNCAYKVRNPRYDKR
ncbi:MAG: hypothetical protein QW607_11370 [Desulfurococcaceae archaeon]